METGDWRHSTDADDAEVTGVGCVSLHPIPHLGPEGAANLLRVSHGLVWAFLPPG